MMMLPLPLHLHIGFSCRSVTYTPSSSCCCCCCCVGAITTSYLPRNHIGTTCISGYHSLQWSFLGGSIIPLRKQLHSNKNLFTPPASCMLNSQIANGAFTFGTVAVLPFYALMVFAPHAKITKRSMESSIPYVILGILYVYLLYLSWKPETFRLMFASKYWLPELPGMAKMFSNEMTMASAWVHLLVVDLFAARQIFHDGIKNNIETRHSVSLCLLFCPVGILAHALTKILIGGSDHGN